MVSDDDGVGWDVRSTLDIVDFAVSPADPELLLVTAITQGFVRSIDGGRTWEPISGAPAVAALGWVSEASVFGVTTDGMVQHSADGGANWQTRAMSADSASPPGTPTERVFLNPKPNSCSIELEGCIVEL